PPPNVLPVYVLLLTAGVLLFGVAALSDDRTSAQVLALLANATATGTPEPSSTATPTATATPANTGTPTPTFTPSVTPTPSTTATRTPSPTPSDTPTFTPTPTPEEHYWMSRPISAENQDFMNPTYLYGTYGDGTYYLHRGVDFDNNDIGVPVYAAAAGTVV